jgi:hypothetical protein
MASFGLRSAPALANPMRPGNEAETIFIVFIYITVLRHNWRDDAMPTFIAHTLTQSRRMLLGQPQILRGLE